MTDSVILIDVVDEEVGNFERSYLERIGHRVLVCHGPDGGAECPILTGAGCPLVDEAHGIVFQLDLDRPQHREILQRYTQIVRPDIPIRVVLAPDQARRFAHLLTGTEARISLTAGELDGFAAEVESADRAAG